MDDLNGVYIAICKDDDETYIAGTIGDLFDAIDVGGNLIDRMSFYVIDKAIPMKLTLENAL